MNFAITDFFSKCDQIRSFLRIWSHLLKKSVKENSFFEQAWYFIDVLPGTYSDWSDCIILTHENTVDNSDLPLSPTLLVFFYHEHIADIDFHCFFFMTKVMALSPPLKAAKYSWTHLFHLFSSRESSGNLISLPRILKFGVNTEHFKSSSIYVNGRLFRLMVDCLGQLRHPIIHLLILTMLTIIFQWNNTDFAL